MPDYSQGKIYKLTSSQTDNVYIGSTTTTLNARFSSHKINKKNDGTCSSKELLKFDDCKIELIEDYPCNSRLELCEREQFFMDLLDNVINNQRAIRKPQQQLNTEYYLKNIDKVKEKALEYRINNPDKVKESIIKYRANNPDKVKESKIKYNNKNKEALKIKHKERNVLIKCEYCEKELGKYGMPRHLKTCKLIK